MGSTFRLFLAAILFTAVAGVTLAQDASAAPPPAAPDVVKPVDELQPIPSVEPEAPAVEPALTVEQSALPVEPIAPAIVDPPAAEKPVATTAKTVTKKTAKKPAEKPAVQVSESLKAAAPVASTAAADTTANTPPADAAVSTAPLQSIAPPPAAANAPAVETAPAETKTTMGIGGWLLAGVVVAALFGGITLIRRRKTRSRTSIVDVANLSLDLEPAPVTRP